ncbi:hypothetical protein EHP00_738 [Ecytonucleospora hepatopenaei]|uniref:Uncharacterized protein n=1 Tax=Ecytonucleospora hepatopenaei TaxID=646526 RepID=A0A1W0E3A7_9MICR|nr:hypothetical protein EHP00_738 [Ecytonucleospora hepatopenaei]
MLFLIILNLYKVFKHIHCAEINPNPNNLNTVVIDTNNGEIIREEREELLDDTSDESNEDNNDENNSVINLVDTNEDEKSATESEQDKEHNNLNKECINTEKNSTKKTEFDLNIDLSDDIYEQNFNKFCEENDKSENKAQNMQYLSVIPEDYEEANERLRKKLSKSNSINGTGTKPKFFNEKIPDNNLSEEGNDNKDFNSLFIKEIKKPEISKKIHFLNLGQTMYLNSDGYYKNNRFSDDEVTDLKLQIKKMKENLANQYNTISTLFRNSLENENVFKTFLKKETMPTLQNLVDFTLDFYIPDRNIDLRNKTIDERTNFIKIITNITLFDNLKLMVEENQRFLDELDNLLFKE